jgi:hypothetical protein
VIQHHRNHTECADAVERGLVAHVRLIVHLTFLNATKIAITYIAAPTLNGAPMPM